jgi:MOSC domain-containing protein YiiM
MATLLSVSAGAPKDVSRAVLVYQLQSYQHWQKQLARDDLTFVTCYRVGMRLGEPTMASLLVAHHRPGFYLRVLTEGHVRAGDEITLTRKGPGNSASRTPTRCSTSPPQTPRSCAEH